MHFSTTTLGFLSLCAVGASFAGTAAAQSFDRQVVLRGLDRPTGVLAANGGDLYFSEIPQPGVMGGANQVSLKDGGSAQIAQVSTGEPEPVNLTMDPATGDVFWTCRSAGVILRRTGGTNGVFLNNLDRPSGISAPGNGKLYVTLVPTPGVPGSQGGNNSVVEIDIATQAVTTLSMGEPEPYDIVADAAGNAYWSCRTAGVILRWDAATQMRSVLLNDLAQPAGISMDSLGNLYFTEVPDPGVGGANNKIWQFDLSTANFTLLSVGEPEPIDVSTTPDGGSVYWSCRTAGVIVRANRIGMQPVVTSPSEFSMGATVRLFLDGGAASAGSMYLAASSAGLGPIEIGARSWSLAIDPVFLATLGQTSASYATGFAGFLDGNGMGTAHLVIPNQPELAGLDIFTGFAVMDPAAPFGFADFSSTHRFEIR